MTFQYPEHFKYPENKRLFFTDHIPLWESLLSPFKDRPNICLEIGSLYGGSSVYMIENFCKTENSFFYFMDINEDEYLKNNLSVYTNVKGFIGESSDSFKIFNHEGQKKEFLDIVYIDGNHMSKYVLEDAVNSFYSLKNYGVMVFDDYGGGLEQPTHMQSKTGVDCFIKSYEKYLNIIYIGYQLILQKIPYTNETDYKENYYNK
jgi:cephalosporin hydroxylase